MFIKKSFSSLLKKASTDEKNYLKSMFLFAQGQMSADDFIQELKNTSGLADYILSDKKIPDQEFEKKNFDRMLADDFQTHESRYDLYRIVYSFFYQEKNQRKLF